MQDERKVLGKPSELLPVQGNCYLTDHGLFDCEVIEEPDASRHPDGQKVEVRLTNRQNLKKPSPSIRRFLIYSTRRAIEENRLHLVFEIHAWALRDSKSRDYLEKEVSL
jgi:hypothetical protein